MLKIPRPGRGKESARRSITQPIQPSRYRHDLTPREDVPAGTRAESVQIARIGVQENRPPGVRHDRRTAEPQDQPLEVSQSCPPARRRKRERPRPRSVELSLDGRGPGASR